MKSLKVTSGFTRLKTAGPVRLYRHTSGKYAVVTVNHNGKLEHQGRIIPSLNNLVARRKLVTQATAEQQFAALSTKYSVGV